MKEIILKADVIEVNRYEFVVLVDEDVTEEEGNQQARNKLTDFLKENTPYTNQSNYENDVLCFDVTSGMETIEVKRILS